jgi:hypothetical protein
MESAGASVTLFEGVIEPGSWVGSLDCWVLVVLVVSVEGVPVGMTRMLEGIQSLVLLEVCSVEV